VQRPFNARSELGAQVRARRQFPPAIHKRTRSFFLTPALSECQLSKKRARGSDSRRTTKNRRGHLSLAVALDTG
jgi:hypothetical protein